MSPKPVTFDDDNPEWTEEDFARARPAADFPELVDAMRRARGRPRGSDKQSISLRVDVDVLERFKAGGPGWQSRMNDALRKAVS